MNDKFCKDCRWREDFPTFGEKPISECHRPGVFREPLDGDYPSISDERALWTSMGDTTKCGPEGAFFKPMLDEDS